MTRVKYITHTPGDAAPQAVIFGRTCRLPAMEWAYLAIHLFGAAQMRKVA